MLLLPLLLAAASLVTASPASEQPWDVIVVGAGPAGIIAASRLAETNRSVLLLEAGGTPSYYAFGGRQRPAWLNGTELSRVDVPGLYSSIFGDQGGLTCAGLDLVNAFGGCTIGGSSAINAGLQFLPPASDWDLYHPAGWKAADLVSAINSLGSKQPDAEVFDTTTTPWLAKHYEAARHWLVDLAGYTVTAINANADQKSKVFGHTVYDYLGGQRGGPAITYLLDAIKRKNFMLQVGTKVLRVLRERKEAKGVRVNVGGVEETVQLNPGGRVILSGGALASPALLMYSGIGDSAVLSRLAAAGRLGGLTPDEWINNTAVGAGLFDNPNTFLEFRNPSLDAYSYSYDSPPARDAANYLNNRTGPYAFAGQTSVFWDQITHDNGDLVGLQGTVGAAGFADFTDAHTITINIYGTSGLLSRGRVELDANFIPGASGDTYYSNPRDADDIATFIRRIYDALPGSGYEALNLPENSTHEQIVTYITTWSTYARGQVNHWSSSCKIGTCVYEDTVVVGTSNLHVVDASIVEPLTVNPQMGVMVAAERAVELILKQDGA